MFFNNFVSVLQLIALPLFFATAAVASVFLTVALVRLFGAQRKLARARRLLIEADLAERGVGIEPAGKPDRKGRTTRKGLKSGAEQKPDDDGKEESADA
mgnify:FL=1